MPNHVHQIKLFITAIDSFEQRFLQNGISQYQLISFDIVQLGETWSCQTLYSE